MTNSRLAPSPGLSGDLGSSTAVDKPQSGEGLTLKVLALYSLLAICVLIGMTLPFATDYVGRDNDDVMRLIEVRDLLAGQSWFDMHQYRLGLAGGTLMHWSRFIDMPIANLIAFFSLFMSGQRAEAAALTIWPLLLVVPLLYGAGLAGFRLGGRPVMHASLALTVILVLSMNRYVPGAIDHHNVQLALVLIIVAMLLDPAHRPRNLAISGLSAGLAIAIGAETTPFIAAVCVAVSLLWAWHGPVYAAAARAFGISLAATVAAAFFLTVPPSAYSQVTCDNLSFGFFALTVIGGGLLAVAAAFFSQTNRSFRFAILAATGGIIGAATVVIAPGCLRGPLADLDPMLVSLWLNGVIEAQSVFGMLQNDPKSLGTFYAIGPIAIAVCLYRIVRVDRREAHAILLGLIVTCYGVGLVQVRGAILANFIASLPLAAAIMDARRAANAQPSRPLLSIGFVALTLASVSSVWGVAGVLLSGEALEMSASSPAQGETAESDCTSQAGLRGLALLPTGVVAAPSNLGANILRYTPHRALSAPYHRNQGGMLTELHIGLSNARQAEAFIRGAGVTAVAFCASDPQTSKIAALEPQGLYADLTAGKVPAYLGPLPQTVKTGLEVFKVTGIP
ncbi:hypothetical protein [Pararhizobium sp.]|uniref:hypothetical protein n=1 Tax=Pararhizobium sp. TaxID=1977563 RepID=UPI002718FB2E|nr:hypothetical protein [Pararhizobium sp.]MDO9417785.1 hypothetical protein [Pararhizobium sp.]